MSKIRNKPIGLIVTENLATAKVFEAHGMDFCCHGQQTVEEACKNADVTVEQLEKELAAVGSKAEDQHIDLSALTTDDLARHIISVHHTYVKTALPTITKRIVTVINAHGANHPELKKIQKDFSALRDELDQHLLKEEEVLFPYIEALAVASREKGARPDSCFGDVADPIAMMEEEHVSAGQLLESIRTTANDFRVPDDGCNTYRLLYQELQEFEHDLHLHIAKENYMLFPQALELESKI
ncbi:MAG: iron-sulfur cluster repair di-iron protein [Victivallaceae bacterium]|nr:iron-sulfur cluster repair di-iron protein [Victivallaceae bacterium]MDD4180947.1 iron-sulfur cluster repair di-iron protein [Victivallaceae bacterium]